MSLSGKRLRPGRTASAQDTLIWHDLRITGQPHRAVYLAFAADLRSDIVIRAYFIDCMPMVLWGGWSACATSSSRPVRAPSVYVADLIGLARYG